MRKSQVSWAGVFGTGTGLRLAAGCAVALALSGFCAAETVAYWQFDDGTEPAEADTLTATVNAPALNGTAKQNESGAKPTFSSDRPGEQIWASSTGPLLNGANTSSLRFVNAGLPDNPNSNAGGVVTAAGSDPSLHASNITVEAFIKTDRHVNYALVVGKTRSGDGAATSWNLDFDGEGRPRVRLDNTNSVLGIGKNNEAFDSQAVVEDGKWHHVAFTYTHTSQMVRVYVDYVERQTKMSAAPLVYSDGDIRIGQGCGGRAFDGWIDEIRVTADTLLPHQFMTAYEPIPTVFHLPFQDAPAGTEAVLATNTARTLITHGTAGILNSGVKPAYSAERAFGDGGAALITDGDGGPVIGMSTGSLLFTNTGLPDNPAAPGSVVTIPGNAYVAPVTNFTAEAFMRVRDHVGFAQIIGKKHTMNDGWIAWSLAYNSEGNLRARFDTSTDGVNTNGHNQTIESGPAGKVNDGLWHHVALTYDYPTKTVRLYKDYEFVREAVTINPVRLDTANYLIGAGDKAFDGWIDEVRFSSRVLTPDQFLRAIPIPPPPGTLLLVQ